MPLNAISDETEVIKLFNRMCDKYLLLDVPGAGTPGMINCCHSGCDNCDFARVFDEMSSGRAKWVALYPYRKHCDGRDHTPPWSKIFEFDSEIICKDQFIQRFMALPSVDVSMGPPSAVSPASEPSREAMEEFWMILQYEIRNEKSVSDSINAGDMAQALARITGAEHGAIYSEFKKKLLS